MVIDSISKLQTETTTSPSAEELRVCDEFIHIIKLTSLRRDKACLLAKLIVTYIDWIDQHTDEVQSVCDAK